MTTICIKTRSKSSKDSKEEFVELDKAMTIKDLKEKLNPKDPSSILLRFKNQIPMDSTEIDELGKDVIFTMENDIEFNELEVNEKENENNNEICTCFKRKCEFPKEKSECAKDYVLDSPHSSGKRENHSKDNKKIPSNLDESSASRLTDDLLSSNNEIFYKNGKPFLIKNRIKKLKFSDIPKQVFKRCTREQLVQFLLISFILTTKNYPLVCIIVFINILKSISLIILKYKIYNKMGNGLIYSIFMFISSFIAIDHARFHN
jgi:hypothetical protein